MLKSSQFTVFNNQVQGVIDTYLNLTETSIQGFKQVVGIQFDAYYNFSKQVGEMAKSLCTANNANQVGKVVQEFVAQSVKASISKNQKLSGVLSNSQTIFSNVASDTIKEAQKSLISSVDKLSAVSPALSKVASKSLQNSISTLNNVADAASKVTAQVAEVAKKNIEVATNVALNTAKKAATQTAAS